MKMATLCAVTYSFFAIATSAQQRPPAGPDVRPFPEVQPYHPVSSLRGPLNIVGSDELEQLTQRWIDSFRHIYPDVQFTLEAKSSLSVGPALTEGRSQIGPLGREFLASEEDAFIAKHGHHTLDIRIAGGAWAVAGRTHEVAFLVNKSNPLERIDFQKLDAIYSTTRRRGYPVDITTWGQLGLKGEWADKPIHLWGLIFADGITHLVQDRVLLGGDYKPSVKEQKAAPDQPAINSIVDSISQDPYALGYGGLGYIQGKSVKALALSVDSHGSFYTGTYDEILHHTYPLSRFVYIHIDKVPGKPLDPKVREFVRFALSAEGQKSVIDEGSYLPLTPDVVKQELVKLK